MRGWGDDGLSAVIQPMLTMQLLTKSTGTMSATPLGLSHFITRRNPLPDCVCVTRIRLLTVVSGKLWREKTFANGEKSRRKLSLIAPKPRNSQKFPTIQYISYHFNAYGMQNWLDLFKMTNITNCTCMLC